MWPHMTWSLTLFNFIMYQFPFLSLQQHWPSFCPWNVNLFPPWQLYTSIPCPWNTPFQFFGGTASFCLSRFSKKIREPFTDDAPSRVLSHYLAMFSSYLSQWDRPRPQNPKSTWFSSCASPEPSASELLYLMTHFWCISLPGDKCNDNTSSAFTPWMPLAPSIMSGTCCWIIEQMNGDTSRYAIGQPSSSHFKILAL